MSEALVKALIQELGQEMVLQGAAIDERYKTDWSRQYHHEPLVVVRPDTTEAVSTVMRLCHAHRHPVTVQGGMTGLVGGAQTSTGDVVLSLERMTGVQEIDADAATMTVWAATPLQVVQEAAQAQGMYFAVDLGARGSCQIGGNISTNAGGNRVIRYGMMREQILGLEVVLADGTVVTSLNKMLKNNAGYDIKQLFIGAEGTLGVITRAVLRLYPAPQDTTCALCVVPDYEAVLRFLGRARRQCGASLLAFEAMWPDFYEFMTQKIPGIETPVACHGQLVVLIECDSGASGMSQETFEAFVGGALEQGEISDAAIASSLKQAQAFWKIRDSVSEFPVRLAPYTSFDVSLPIRQIGSFVQTLRARFEQRIPGAVSLYFGHIGDSNLHVVVHVPREFGVFPKALIEEVVYGLVGECQGSISAEHGIGTRKKAWLGHSRTQAEIDLMRKIKQALDPHDILNPGKVL